MSELEIDENIAFQKAFWFAERMCWVMMFVIVLVAITGLLGEGLFGETTLGNPDTLQVTFNKLLHANRTTEITIYLKTKDVFFVDLAQDYVSNVRDLTIVPSPQSVVYRNGGLRYIFSGEGGFAEMVIFCRPCCMGLLKGFVESNGYKIEFSQFVYP